MQSWYKNIDFTIVLLWFLLVTIGLVALYSSTSGMASEFMLDSVQRNFSRQSLWVVVSFIALCVTLLFPVRFFQNIAIPAYVLMVILLIMALFLGTEVNGARSWLRIGPVRLQVSELAKLSTLMAVAHLVSVRPAGGSKLSRSLLIVFIVSLPAFIIILQNDTGTALIFLAIIPLLLFWSGVPPLLLLMMVIPVLTGYLTIVYLPAAVALIAITLISLYFYSQNTGALLTAAVANLGVLFLFKYGLTLFLQPYHVARVLSFTNPEAAEYRNTIGFHLVQSKAAIGSGGFWGKGFMQGTQTQGAYVPEQTTDFVFSIIGEEFGFLGSLFVLLCFGILLIRLILLASNIKHPFGSTIASGVAAFFLVHVFLNIGMTTGILPVIGIPLPLISYGGSALLTETLMIALVLNLYMRREDFSIYGY